MKTAIQNLQDKLVLMGFEGLEGFIEEYIEQEKQQIIRSYNESSWETDKDIDGQQYYNETFEICSRQKPE